jgi:hypothetical protein
MVYRRFVAVNSKIFSTKKLLRNRNSLNTSRKNLLINKINLLEPAGLQDLAIGAIGAGVAVASVYHLCACLAVVSWRTLAMEIPEQT